MPSIGPMEIVAVAAIALIVFGPEKLPEIARTVGRTLAQFRKMADEVRDEFKDGLDFDVDDDDDAPGPAPRRDHPNVRATEAASAPQAARESGTNDDEPEEEFDPNYDIEAAEAGPADDDTHVPASSDAGGESDQPAEGGAGEPSAPQTGTSRDEPGVDEGDADRPPEQRAG